MEVKSSLELPAWKEKAHAPVKIASSSGTGGLSVSATTHNATSPKKVVKLAPPVAISHLAPISSLLALIEKADIYVAILPKEYGWLHDPARNRAWVGVAAHGRCEWLDYQQLNSISEIEMTHGVLNDPSLRPWAVFARKGEAIQGGEVDGSLTEVYNRPVHLSRLLHAMGSFINLARKQLECQDACKGA